MSDFATPWTDRLFCPQDSPRQEYYSELPFPSPEDLPEPGIEPGSPALQADSLLFEPPGKPKNIEVGSILSPGDLPHSGI